MELIDYVDGYDDCNEDECDKNNGTKMKTYTNTNKDIERSRRRQRESKQSISTQSTPIGRLCRQRA